VQATAARYPMKFRARPVEKVWGGRHLESRFGKPLPGHGPIGEIWGVWDGLKIVNGPARGDILRTRVERDPALVASDQATRPASGDFPLLIKFLDANENLSIQVHPDDDYARRVEGVPYGKCEMWYILQAEPGAVVYHGTKKALNRDELTRCLADGSIVEYLAKIEVRPGDVLINPPGTIHALGAGIVLYELQQSCDLTYRLYDWDRGTSGAPRSLHLDKGADVSDLDPPAQHCVQPVRLDDETVILCACQYFVAELHTWRTARPSPGTDPRFEIFTVLEGAFRLRHPDGWRLDVRSGDSVLVPARVGPYTVTPTSDACQVIRSYVPNLRGDVVDPLLRRGATAEQIVQLGGDPRRSDLRDLVT